MTEKPAAPPEHIMQFFGYDHLPPKLQEISRPFCELAKKLTDPDGGLPRNPERTVALRKLLEAKDAAVRALIAKDRWCPTWDTPPSHLGHSTGNEAPNHGIVPPSGGAVNRRDGGGGSAPGGGAA